MDGAHYIQVWGSNDTFSSPKCRIRNTCDLFDPFVKSENETKKIVLDTESTEIDFAQAAWINANYNSAGFYVTKLSDELLEKVLQNLDQLSVADRLKIVYDQLQLAKSGLGSTAAFFDMLLKFKCENNF